MTPSHACAQEGELDCLRYLIKVAHAHEHVVDNNGCTLLHYGNMFYLEVVIQKCYKKYLFEIT